MPYHRRRNQQNCKQNARQTKFTDTSGRLSGKWYPIRHRFGYKSFPHTFRKAPVPLPKGVREQ